MTNDHDQTPSRRPPAEPVPPFSSRRPRFDRVHVAETPNCGLGVFSDAPILAGHAVGQVHGNVMPGDYRSRYCVGFAGAVLEPEPPYRFLNHSCRPNCEFVEWEIQNEDEGAEVEKIYELWVHALRDIQKGEELTIDYAWDWQSAIPCQCGAPDCRGWICKMDELEICRRQRGAPASYREDADRES